MASNKYFDTLLVLTGTQRKGNKLEQLPFYACEKGLRRIFDSQIKPRETEIVDYLLEAEKRIARKENERKAMYEEKRAAIPGLIRIMAMQERIDRLVDEYSQLKENYPVANALLEAEGVARHSQSDAAEAGSTAAYHIVQTPERYKQIMRELRDELDTIYADYIF